MENKSAKAIRALQELESMHRTIIADKAERIDTLLIQVKELEAEKNMSLKDAAVLYRKRIKAMGEK